MSDIMRFLTFKQTVNPVVELLNSQLDAAMQIIAALVLTDEEGDSWSNQSDSRPDPGWIRSMREDILSDYMRPQLIQALKHQGFLTNTHAGFCVTPLLETPSNMRGLNKTYRIIEEIAAEYADGKGEDMPETPGDHNSKGYHQRSSEDHKNFWVNKIMARGVSEELANYAFQDQGGSVLCMAALERIMRPVRAKQKIEEDAHLLDAVNPSPFEPPLEGIEDQLNRVRDRLKASWVGKQGILDVIVSHEDWKVYVQMQHDVPDPVWMPEEVEHFPIEILRKYPAKDAVPAPVSEPDEDDDE